MLNKYEKSIQDKLNEFCNKYGTLYYRVLKHPISETYNELDIVTKKSLLNKLNNTIVLSQGEFGADIEIIVSKEQALNVLKHIDKQLSHRMLVRAYGKNINKNNRFLADDTFYIKLYTDKENTKQVDLSNKEREEILKNYIGGSLAKFAIHSGFNLPLLDLDNWERHQFQRLDLIESMEDGALQYICKVKALV